MTGLNLTVDGHRTSYLALREHEAVTGRRWLALGGDGHSPVPVVPPSWRHLPAIVPRHDIDAGTLPPEEWMALAAAARPGIPVADRHVRRCAASGCPSSPGTGRSM